MNWARLRGHSIVIVCPPHSCHLIQTQRALTLSSPVWMQHGQRLNQHLFCCPWCEGDSAILCLHLISSQRKGTRLQNKAHGTGPVLATKLHDCLSVSLQKPSWSWRTNFSNDFLLHLSVSYVVFFFCATQLLSIIEEYVYMERRQAEFAPLLQVTEKLLV